jgi:DNA polymerase-4
MRTIIHWDADRFFASIEQAADRRLRHRPVAVGAVHRGAILSASPEARRLGVRPGWPTARARRAIPHLVIVPPHYDLYERFSDQILSLCYETSPAVEPASVGAAWIDLTGAERLLHQSPETTVARLRKTVREWLHVSLSAGIASNKLTARIAARLRKPGAQVTVPPGTERDFLAPLPLRALAGLDSQALATLEVAGIHSIGQLARIPLDALASVLGRSALLWQRRAQGLNEEPVAAKQPQTEGWHESIEFAEDAWEEPVLLAALRQLTERLMAQVRAGGAEIRRLTLDLRYADRDETRRSFDAPEPTALESEFLPVLPKLLADTWTRRVRIRSLRLSASRVYRPSPQLDLFAPPPRREADVKLASTIDRLRRRFGQTIVQRGFAA